MDRDYIKTVPGVSGAAGSPWLHSDAREYPALDVSRTSDALIVGGGITGVLAASALAARGLTVVLLERRRLASGATGHSTAKVSALHETAWTELVKMHGVEIAHMWAEANAAAVNTLASIAERVGVSGSTYRMPAYLASTTTEGQATLLEHTKALDSVGLRPETTPAPLPFSGNAVGLQDQLLIDPAALVVAMAEELATSVDIYERTPVRALESVDGGWAARTDSGSVTAPIAILADHAPIHDTAAFFGRLFPYAHYCLEVAPETQPPNGMWLQVDGEKITLRPTQMPAKTWIVGGGHSRVGSVEDERVIYASLEESARKLIGPFTTVRHWSTHDMWTSDGLPFVGQMPRSEGLYFAAGYAGWGLTKAVAAVEVLDALIAGETHELPDALSPSRLPSVKEAAPLLKETLRVGSEFITGLLPSQKDSKPKLAGEACTHMGCATKWNTAEGTVDCPCHGSRFSDSGSVLYGPAKDDLV